jgi:hypothetical protein
MKGYITINVKFIAIYIYSIMTYSQNHFELLDGLAMKLKRISNQQIKDYNLTFSLLEISAHRRILSAIVDLDIETVAHNVCWGKYSAILSFMRMT